MRLIPFKRQQNELAPSFSLFDDFIDKFFSNDIPSDYRLMAIDVLEKDNSFIVKANLPGVKKENIAISLKENQLVIEAKHETSSETHNHSIIRSERYIGNYQRKIILPDNIDPDNISAKLENGVLYLTVPKIEPKPRKEITIS